MKIRKHAMLCRTNLMEFLPMIVYPASRLISPASKVMVICLAILWNSQLLAAADEHDKRIFRLHGTITRSDTQDV